MDSMAIMQGVATVFIANAYGVHLGVSGYLTLPWPHYHLLALLVCQALV